MRSERERLSRRADAAQAMGYCSRAGTASPDSLEDARLCLTTDAAERALRGAVLGHKAWLFCGSDRGGERTAYMYTLITTAKLADVVSRPGSPTS